MWFLALWGAEQPFCLYLIFYLLFFIYTFRLSFIFLFIMILTLEDRTWKTGNGFQKSRDHGR